MVVYVSKVKEPGGAGGLGALTAVCDGEPLMLLIHRGLSLFLTRCWLVGRVVQSRHELNALL